MKQSTVVKFDALLNRAVPLSSEAIAVLITHILADDMGDRYPVNDDEHIVEKRGVPLYEVDGFEPKALIYPASGVLFINADGFTYAYDWQSKASSLPEQIYRRVADSEKLSDAEIAEVFVNDILPELEDDYELSEEDIELKELLYI